MGSVLATIEEVGLPPTVYHYLPMLRSAVAASRVNTAQAFEGLAEAAASERRTSSPFLATDVCVAVRPCRVHADQPEVALFALGAVKDIGQRTAGVFGWRRLLDEQLRPLVDEERAAVVLRRGRRSVAARRRERGTAAATTGLRCVASRGGVDAPIRGSLRARR